MKSIRPLLIGGMFILAVGVLSACNKSEAETPLPTVMVYKSPTCGCCHKWVAHMEEAGFPVETKDMVDVTPIKEQYGVRPDMRSCHTAIVDGYVIEGHVPAADVKRLLKERPDVTGLAAPGMPIGSPGMESARPEPYDVIAFKTDGGQYVFAHH